MSSMVFPSKLRKHAWQIDADYMTLLYIYKSQMFYHFEIKSK